MVQETQVWLSIAILGLLLASSFFSMSETALLAANRNRLRATAEATKSRGAVRVLRLLEKPQEVIATILVGNNLVNVAAAALATALAIELFGSVGIGIATGAMTLVVLLFGEVTPKTFASKHAEWVAIRISGPVTFFHWLFLPVSRLLSLFAFGLIRVVGGKPKSSAFEAEDEIKVLLDVGQEQGSIDEHEADFIEGVFKFTDRTIKEVCKPLSEVVWLKRDDKLAVVLEKANATGFSRLPVLKSETLEVLGMVYVKDLLFVADGDLQTLTASALLRPIGRYSPDRTVAQSFRQMQREGTHLGMVIGPDGLPVGLVSLEDLIEEIMGEILDEYEMGARRVTRARRVMEELRQGREAKEGDESAARAPATPPAASGFPKHPSSGETRAPATGAQRKRPSQEPYS